MVNAEEGGREEGKDRRMEGGRRREGGREGGREEGKDRREVRERREEWTTSEKDNKKKRKQDNKNLN